MPNPSKEQLEEFAANPRKLLQRGQRWGCREAPFDKEGNQVSYPAWDTEMRPVGTFEDTLTFVRFERGRSAARAIWRRTNGTTVVMFLSHLEEVMGLMRDGAVADSLWHYVKRGENYGVAYA